MKKTKVGIVGCGMISETYFNASKKFNMIEVVACSDIIPERSKAKEEKHGVPAMTNDELFARDDIEIVLNLTPPQVHSKIAIDTLNAGIVTKDLANLMEGVTPVVKNSADFLKAIRENLEKRLA